MYLLSYIRGDFVYCPVLLVLFNERGAVFVVLGVVLYEKSGHQRTSEDKIITELLKVKKIAFFLLTFLDQVIRIGLALGDKEC